MKKLVEVFITKTIEVTVDESQFTPEFMADFERNHWQTPNGIDDHIKTLANLKAEGHIGDDDETLHPYGSLAAMGICLEEIESDVSFELTDLPLELDV